MPGPSGFGYVVRGDEVVITHHGRPVTVLRGRRAMDFLDEVEGGDAQELRARLTGNYGAGTSGRHGTIPATGDARRLRDGPNRDRSPSGFA